MDNSQTNTGVKKVFSTIATIFLLVLFVTSLIFVWFNGITLYPGNNPGITLDFRYMLFDMWKNITEATELGTTAYSPLAMYTAGSLLLCAFIAQVAIVYIFGIKGFIQGLKNIMENKPLSIAKEGIIVSLTVLFYNIIALNLASPICGVIGASRSVLDMFDFNAFVCWSAMIILLVYVIIRDFTRKDIPGSVANILFSIVLIFTPILFYYPLTQINDPSISFFEYFTGLIKNDGTIGDTELVGGYVGLVGALLVIVCSISLFIIMIVKMVLKGEKLTLATVLPFSIIVVSGGLLGMMFVPKFLNGIQGGCFRSTMSLSISCMVLLIVGCVLKESKKTETTNEKVVDEQ